MLAKKYHRKVKGQKHYKPFSELKQYFVLGTPVFS